MSPLLSFSVLAFSLAACSKEESPAVPESVEVVGSRYDAAAGEGARAGDAAVANEGASASAGTIPGDASGDHPLKVWMKAHAARAVNSRDFEALSIALEKIAGFAPPGYPFWASIARDGADAARAEDIDAVRGACRGCHSQYRDTYKRELRDRPIGD
jgi:hypothetical protein